MCIDESMPAYQPCSSQLGRLSFLTFIKRKPRLLRTEFKRATYGVAGIITWLEIQEGDKICKNYHSFSYLGLSICTSITLDVIRA
jgi:hypothetical protein